MLEALGEPWLFSSAEPKIMKATRIILAGDGEIAAIAKRLHLLNLFGMLRMLQKPVMGIGAGMHVMCEVFGKTNTACLGMFPANTMAEPVLAAPAKLTVRELITTSGTSAAQEELFHFSYPYFLPVTEFTTAVVTAAGKEYSAILRRGKFTGLQFSPGNSGAAGKAVLQQFLTAYY